MKSQGVSRTIATYAIFGPLVGACVVAAGTVFSDAGVASQWPSLAAAVFLFAIPFGLPQALFAGISHVVASRITQRRAVIASTSAVAGASGSMVFAAALGTLGPSFSNPASAVGLLLPPVVSAIVVAAWLSRRKRDGS